MCVRVCVCICIYEFDVDILYAKNEHEKFFWVFFYGFQDDSEWMNWQNVLSERNAVENVYKWACGYVLFNYDVPFK